MKKLIALLSLLMIMLVAVVAQAAQTRVFVGEFNAVGVQNRDELKATLQTLLASRLNSDKLLAVGSASEADVLVSGTYIAIGKVYSIDALARTSGGRTLTRTFIQGDAGEELIPVVGKLADKLSVELSKLPVAASTVSVQPAVAVAAPVVAAPLRANPDFIKAAPSAAPKSDFIKPQESGTVAGGWLSKRLDGAAELLAVGRPLPAGGREVLLADERKLTLYHQAADMLPIATHELGEGHRIIAVDTVTAADGGLDIYLTIIRNGEPHSQLLTLREGKLVRLADALPWYFRGISVAGGAKKIYMQGAGRTEQYFGNIYELERQGGSIKPGKALKLPAGADIYSFNQFKNSEGRLMSILINADGYLIVFDDASKEIWRSNDKFGGSELYFQREDLENSRTTGDKYRWFFINQRIQVSAKGEILVGKNSGMWVLGNARSYSKGSVYCFVWNGSTLEEKWHTRETQNYMPDYYLDDNRNELLIMQIVQRPGLFSKGGTNLSIKKVE